MRENYRFETTLREPIRGLLRRHGVELFAVCIAVHELQQPRLCHFLRIGLLYEVRIERRRPMVRDRAIAVDGAMQWPLETSHAWDVFGWPSLDSWP